MVSEINAFGHLPFKHTPPTPAKDPDAATGCADDHLPGDAEQWRAAIEPTPDAGGLVDYAIAELAGSDFECIRTHGATLATAITTLTAKAQADAAEIERLREAVSRAEAAFKVIAGSHWERFGMCQTDIEAIPDLSADEAMCMARDWLSFDDYPALGEQP